MPFNMEMTESGSPKDVTQLSFEEGGFLQHQPIESIIPFEEWRCSRFGNMRPAVIIDSMEQDTKCDRPQGECGVAGLPDSPLNTPVIENP